LTFMEKPDDFDLVLTDMTMPKMSGLELADEIHRVRPDARVILCTGYGEENLKQLVTQGRIEKFILKPATIRKIALTVRQVLDRSVQSPEDC
ncbi:MAG TPA: response regulator, partial [bacterium]|nr:response regulator [bacterium]